MSDLHLDHDARIMEKFKGQNLMFPPSMEGDDDTCLIIAGDIWYDGRFYSNKYQDHSSWLKAVSEQFKYVVFIFGNHDYWKANFYTEASRCRIAMIEQDINNAFLLDCSSIILDNIKFVGGTLWTDYGKRDPISTISAPNFMNDYRQIRVGKDYRKFKPNDALQVFDKTKKLIFNTDKGDCDKLIVVTHMAPSYMSVHEKYRNESDKLANTWYYSDLDEYIIDSEISHYFHGHVHNSFDYMIGDTNVLCNPRGYGTENTEFDPFARITL
jgi:predicted phosphohydrolase